MKLHIAVPLFILLSPSLICQTENSKKAFDSIFYDVAVNVSSVNPTKALHIADSLQLYSKTEKQKMRALMLIADLLQNQGNRKQSIKNALDAMTIAEKIEDYQWQAKIYGFLSTQYRYLGFLDQGKVYLEKGIAVSSKIENKVLASQFRGMTYQEMAYYAWEEEKYKEAIENVKFASLSFDVLADGKFKDFLLGNNEEMYGRSLSCLKEYEAAKPHYYKSFKYLKSSDAENTLWGAASYQGLGNIFLTQNNLDSAEVYLKKALKISEKTDHIDLKEKIFQDMSSFYRKKREMDSFAFYESKYNAIVNEKIEKTKESINSEFNRINKKEREDSSHIIYYLLVIAALVTIGTIIFYSKRKVWFKSYDLIPKQVDERAPSFVLPPATEKELLKKLEEFEGSHDYLDKNMSFSVLVGQLGTNAKYLSHIIKNHKNKDYNTYINELRIQYIVDKLKTDPEYLNYKISYLAKESGFSSHSKFSANFKRMVNLSPSEFIESLRD